MTPETQSTTEETPENKARPPLFSLARKVLLASIGAMALAQEEIEDFVNKLVERGEIAEKEGKSLVHELQEKRQQRAQEFEERFGKRLEEVLGRMNIPTKADVAELNEKIAALSKKIEELQRHQG